MKKRKSTTRFFLPPYRLANWRVFNFFKGFNYKKKVPSGLGHAVGVSTLAVRAISCVFIFTIFSPLNDKVKAW